MKTHKGIRTYDICTVWCGKWLHRVHISEDWKFVTCKSCLKLRGDSDET